MKKKMNNAIKIFNESDTVILKAGDRVRLVEPEVLISRSNDSDIKYEKLEDGTYLFIGYISAVSFKSTDVADYMLNILSKYDTQEIASINDDGDIKFYDIPYTWPKEVILEVVDEDDLSLSKYIDSSKIDYVRIYKNEVGTGIFECYCQMPHAIISNDNESVYFYTISQNDVNPSKHLEPEE